MTLKSHLFTGQPQLEQCLISDKAHIAPGARGDAVMRIQRALIFLDDAKIMQMEQEAETYGASTALAVLAFKTRRRIINASRQSQPDNIVGKMTLAALDAEMFAAQKRHSQGGRRQGPVYPGDSAGEAIALQSIRTAIERARASFRPADDRE